MDTVQLREAHPQDCQAMYSMISELENEQPDTVEFEKVFAGNLSSPNIHYIVATANNEIVGFISLHIQNLLHHTGPAAEIQELFVKSDFRSHGVGKQLIDEARRIALAHGSKIFEVTCNMRREAAHRFYEKNGLEKTHYKFTENI